MTITQEIIQNKKRLSLYHQAALKRLQKNQGARQSHWHQCLDISTRVAQTLKTQFHISKIALFGSILDSATFTQWSDIDIAVWGLEPSQTLLAIDVAKHFSDEVEINLVDINTAKPEIYQRILEKHQEI